MSGNGQNAVQAGARLEWPFAENIEAPSADMSCRASERFGIYGEKLRLPVHILAGPSAPLTRKSYGQFG
jgi:hypothetical protein